MKTTMESKRRIPVLLSILCAGLVTAFLGGCAEGPYVTAYDGGYMPHHIRRTRTMTRTPTTYRLIRSYARAFVIMMPTVHAIIAPGLSTATGTNSRRAVG